MKQVSAVKPSLPKPSAFERGLAFVLPTLASKIYATRVSFAMADSYHGASKSRRAMAGWNTGNGDADADTLPYLEDLRNRSRDLIRNNSIGGAAINVKVTSIVGTGLTLQARVNRDILKIDDAAADEWERNTEAEFRLWSKECDIERSLSFEAIQELAFRSVLENGDVLITTPYLKREKQAYGLKVQLTESDRICNADNVGDTTTLSGGVERDSSGAPSKYHVLLTHPGQRLTPAAEWERIPAFGANGRRNAILLYHKLRIGQTRGVPDLAPVIEEIKQLGRYTESEAMSAVVSSFFTVFIKTPDGEGLDTSQILSETGGSQSDADVKMGYGNIVDLAEGEDVSIANPGRPNPAFDGFVQAVTRQIGARLEIPFELLTKHFTASYSASRAAMLEAWRYFMGRRKWLADGLCRPLYELFLTEAVSSGRISAPGFLTGDPLVRDAWLGADWIGDAPGQIDEGKAVGAAKARIDAGFSNEAIETTALTGRDRDSVYRQRRKEIEQRRADNMFFAPDAKEDPALEPKTDDEAEE